MSRIADHIRQEPFWFLDEAKSALLFTDIDKKVLYSNPAFQRLFKCKKEDVLKKKCWQLIHPDDPECRGCPQGLCHNQEVGIDGRMCNLIVSGFSCGDELILRVIQDATKALTDVAPLCAEVEELCRIVTGIISTDTILHVCSECHKIRLNDGSWVKPSERSILDKNTRLSHGFCPPCARKYFDEINLLERNL